MPYVAKKAIMVENKWYNDEKTIILQILTDNWTWDELILSNKTDIPNLMATVNHEVHVIASLEESPSLPSGSALLKGRDAATGFPNNLGLLVIISPSKYVRVLVDMVSSIAIINDERKLKSAETIDNALKIIHDFDETRILD